MSDRQSMLQSSFNVTLRFGVDEVTIRDKKEVHSFLLLDKKRFL